MITDPQNTNGSARNRVIAAHSLARMVVLAFAASVVVYIVMELVFLRSTGAGAGSPELRAPFYVATLFLSLGSITLRRTQLRWLKLQNIAARRGVGAVIKHFVNVTIISAALGEVIGILGLLLGLLGGETSHALTLGIVGLMITLSNYPRRGAWEQTIDYIASSAS